MIKLYKLIAKLLTFWVPVSSTRKSLRKKIVEHLSQKTVNKCIYTPFFDELILKYDEWKLKKSDIETLILGSSHAAAGFVSKQYSPTAFNLASASQDLYYSYRLLQCCSKESKKLKEVYLFFSVFSCGSELQKTSEKERCAYFKYLFEIPYKYKTDKDLERYYKQASLYYKKKENNKKIDTNGFIEQKIFFDKNFPVEERARTHLRENQRINDSLSFLEKIRDFCIQNNIKLFIIIPPARKDYREALPDESILFEKLYKIKNLPIIKSYYADENFVYSDFGDFDHLNGQGAQKLTSLIKKDVG